MAKFLNHYNIKKELLSLFKEAEDYIFLISPFIKLNDEMKRALSRKKDDNNFEIVVLFGKNEFNLSKSLSKDDMEFFKQFKNVEISYNANLHAKLYANEFKTIVTSLNLHQFSVKNNIEIGILIERKFLDFTKDTNLDSEAFEYISEILEDSDLVYQHKTKQKSFLFGLFKGDIKKEVSHDDTDAVYKSSNNFTSFSNKSKNNGFCIRTGREIPFNMNVPYSKEAYESWSKWKNKDYKEKYCHFSGESSNGETCFSKPVLRKNYKQANVLQEKLNSRK